MKTFTSADGLNLAYYEWGSPGSGVPVVLHHGFSASALSNWELPGVVAALTEAGRHVFAIDSRGHGASDKPHDPAFYGEHRMAEDVSTLLGVIGAEQIDLVGYSMGGIVALLVAISDKRVRRLVAGGIGSSAVELGGLDSRALPGRALVDGLQAQDVASIDDPQVMAFRAFADAAGADRQALAAQVLASHRSPIALDRITAPTLVLAGVDDHLATRPEVLADAITGARWRVLSGDHLTAVRNPDFASAIVKFLA
ncbi:alpha/beta fold hydrolase [Catelliglobosispora koreensis]|uniref:alpha/beta fold hydrolase n=1 Tax=Catelliglobosispora koreensis TaxID=129052 RepID=UPI00037DCF64|nr:alpha/beta fold hydrolase [Catelliglobosispora koreensis]